MVIVHRLLCPQCEGYIDTVARDVTPTCECGVEMEFGGTVGCLARLTDTEGDG